MSDKIFVKPVIAGTIIRQPERNYQAMPADGAEVPHSSYYRRRISDGDLEITQAPAKKQRRKSAAPAGKTGNTAQESE